jgi:hypothetical protein
MIYKVAPVYGKTNPLIYLGICSTVGSVSVMSVKAFGIALKLTFAGKNQFTSASTYVFMIITAVCILTQMNYFNKALSQFPTNMYDPSPSPIDKILAAKPCEDMLTSNQTSVNPLYYVTFTTATLCASFILFSGFNTTDTVNTLSLLCGFLVTFTGVYLLNLSRGDPNGTKMLSRPNGDTGGSDMISSIQTRMSLEARRSGHVHRGSLSSNRGGQDRESLMRAFDEEEAAGLGLTDLADEEDDRHSSLRPSYGHMNGSANGHGLKSHTETIEMQNRKGGDK